MKTILRNLFYTLKRFRLASILNLIGLSTAFAAFIVLMMKVSYEQEFDNCYPNADRLVILTMGEEKDRSINVLPRGPIDFLMEQVPGIEYGTIYAPAWQKVSLYTDPKNKQVFYERPWAVYPDFGKVIGLTFTEGSDQEMNQPESAILSESKARKLFPKGDALGSYLYIDGTNWLTPEAQKYRICGIYKDLPENSQFKNDIYVPMGDTQKDDWGSQNFFAFFRLKPNVTLEEVNHQIASTHANKRLYRSDADKLTFKVFPIRQLYYDLYSPYFFETGNRSTITLLVGIGILIIVIACINLINFSTALAPMRMRSINTQKVLGSHDSELRRGLTAESVCTVMLAWLFSLGIVAGLIHLNLLSFMGFTPSLLIYWKFVLLSGVIALFTGIIAGLYPAYYMTSFPPALVLKGNYALSGKGRKLRISLIGFQYVVSFALIVMASFIYLQNHFMRNHKLGIDKDQLLVAELPDMDYTSSPYRNFDTQLKQFAEVEDIAYANWNVGGSEGYTGYAIHYKDEWYGHNLINVSTNFCRVLGLKVEAGTDFQPADSTANLPLKFIATQDFQQAIRIPIGEVFDFNAWQKKAQIKGYVNNVQFTSLKTESTPYVFCTNSLFEKDRLRFTYIRIKAGSNMDEALAHIRQTMKACFSEYPTDVMFFNQMYAQLYQKETDQQQMITLFSLLAILISLVGVFGLVIFEAEHRRKEIGVRKVYGASTRQILWMFGRSYVMLTVISSLIATPIAWYAVSKWLESFNEKVTITPWVFLVACIVIGLITLVTITIQNYRAATANPIDSLKSE